MYAEKMADSVMTRYHNPNDFPYLNWSYSQGFLMWSLKLLYEKGNEQKYYDYIYSYYDQNIDKDGTIHGFTGESLDSFLPGATLAWLYSKTNESRFKIACDNIYVAYKKAPRNNDGGLWHSTTLECQTWIDGLYMSGLFILNYGRYIGNREQCFDELVSQLDIGFKNLEKDNTGLLYHAYCQNCQAPWSNPITGCSQEVWSEGLGWYSMMLIESLKVMQPNTDDFKSVFEKYNKLVNALMLCKDEVSSMWYDIVDKPNFSGNWIDSSGSAMFTYSIRGGLNLGILSDDVVDKTVKRSYISLIGKCSEGIDGGLNLFEACDGVPVQKDYYAYVNFTKTINAKEAVAAFICASVVSEK